MPLPRNRAITGKREPRPLVRLIKDGETGVLCKAKSPLAEHDHLGEVQRFEADDTFITTAARAKALGAALIEVVPDKKAEPAKPPEK